MPRALIVVRREGGHGDVVERDAHADADVAIWTIKIDAGARWTLPAASGPGTRRKLYFFKGAGVIVGGRYLTEHSAIELRAGDAVELVNGDDTSEFLMLQARPLAEPGPEGAPLGSGLEVLHG